jgi:2-dehydropantoate 2-reductase
MEVKMDLENPRILVIGAGVNGSTCAAGLFNAGMDVRLLARGRRLQDLQQAGILIENPFTRRRRFTRVPLIERLDPDDRYDYVLVVVRKNQVRQLLPALARNGSPNIVFMGNNLSGPDEFIQILGKERVMMGGVVAAGKREDCFIRAIVFKSPPVPFGEVDGSLTPRLNRLIGIFQRAGFKAQASNTIVDFQTTHGVGVALIGTLVIKHGCDNYALARSPEELKLYVDAMQAAHQVLRLLGRRIVPKSEVFLEKLPRFLQVAGLQALLNSKLGEVGLAWHCSQAPDEIAQMAGELEALVEKSGLPVPAIRKVLGSGNLHGLPGS